MTTFATNEHTDVRERTAWARYADTLRRLGPAAYAAAEPPAWDHLQEELAEIARDRVAAAADAPVG